MIENTLALDITDGIATLTLNRPKVLNALNETLAKELVAKTAQVEFDPKVRCVVLRGSGGSFMAGGDINMFVAELDKDPEERRFRFHTFIQHIHPAILSLNRMAKPVIASLEGAVAGFGMSLMSACDLAIAADTAFFTLAYTNIGTSPDGGSTYHLPRLVGARKAKELMMLNEKLDAQKALAYGLVNWVVPEPKLEEETYRLAKRLADGPTLALAHTKFLVNQSFDNNLPTQLQAEEEAFADCSTSQDFGEATTAFVQKRKATFNGY